MTVDENRGSESRTFEADVGKLLNLIVHSVYSDRDVFIRELISNAADACEKLRYEAIASPALLGADPALRTTITIDAEKRPYRWGQRHRDEPRRVGPGARNDRAFRDQGVHGANGSRPGWRRGDAHRPVWRFSFTWGYPSDGGGRRSRRRGRSQSPDALLEASKAEAADVLHADGYIFATPENLAAMAGIMKDFFDRTYYAALERIRGRPYAIMVCAGSDGQSAVRQIERIATGWRLRLIADPIIICTHAQTPEAIFAPKLISPQDLSRCEELGAALAAGLTLGIF